MSAKTEPLRLRAVTRATRLDDDLLRYASAATPLAWLRRGDGIVAAGAPVLTLVSAASDHTYLADAWRDVAATAHVDDDVALPGTGLVALGTFAFDPTSSATNVLIVPSTIVGRQGEVSWVTHIWAEGDEVPDAAPAASDYADHWSATLGPGSLTQDGYQDAVRAALAAIADGEASKVVVARDVAGTIPGAADLRRLVHTLEEEYPDTWAFAVDGLIGASPETLVTASRGTVTARVLAGTTVRGTDAAADHAARDSLIASDKDQAEHGFAVRSVLGALEPLAEQVSADAEPFALELPNLWHLATDVAGTLTNGSSALDLVAALHPTAAVAGTPTGAALEVIRRIEPFDRGRYAGPVGWVDHRGDGEWAIALRCAQVESARGAGDRPFTAYAGAGIVAGSDPETELRETRVKFRPIIDALA